MAYSTIAPEAKNLVFLGGMMNVKPEWMAGLTENFRDQVRSFRAAWQERWLNPDDLTFVVGFNSPASVRLTNAARKRLSTGENDIILHMPADERIEAFSKMAEDIGATGIIEFDEEKLNELFSAQFLKRQPFVGIGKRGYNADGADGLPVCEGMAYIDKNGGTALTMPQWKDVASVATASTHQA